MRRCIKLSEEQCDQLDELWTSHVVFRKITLEELFDSTDEICGTKLNHEKVRFKTGNIFTDFVRMRHMNKIWSLFIEKAERKSNPKMAKANALLKRTYKLWGFCFVFLCLYAFFCFLAIVTGNESCERFNIFWGALSFLTIVWQFINWIEYNHIFKDD